MYLIDFHMEINNQYRKQDTGPQAYQGEHIIW